MTRYKLLIEYDGSPFVGWQKQEIGLSIQESIESSVWNSSKNRLQFLGQAERTLESMLWGRSAILIYYKRNWTQIQY